MVRYDPGVEKAGRYGTVIAADLVAPPHLALRAADLAPRQTRPLLSPDHVQVARRVEFPRESQGRSQTDHDGTVGIGARRCVVPDNQRDTRAGRGDSVSRATSREAVAS